MKSKQTVRVADVLARANYYLAYHSPYITPDMRKGAASLLETILHDSGNYLGYTDGGDKREDCHRHYFKRRKLGKVTVKFIP
jgi:hypothetical protein